MHRFKLIVINIVLLFAGIILVEIGIRIFIEYEPGYYTGIQSKDSCIQYPYGEICLNSDGYPDDEFNLKGKNYVLAISVIQYATVSQQGGVIELLIY